VRYAIVIEKAEGNYSAYVPDLPDALLPALLSTMQSVKSERQLNFTCLVCAKTAPQSPRLQAALTMWRSPLNGAIDSHFIERNPAKLR
jgi:hypothetical protein